MREYGGILRKLNFVSVFIISGMTQKAPGQDLYAISTDLSKRSVLQKLLQFNFRNKETVRAILIKVNQL